MNIVGVAMFRLFGRFGTKKNTEFEYENFESNFLLKQKFPVNLWIENAISQHKKDKTKLI